MDQQIKSDEKEIDELIKYYTHQIFQIKYNKKHNLVPKIENKINNILSQKKLNSNFKKDKQIGTEGCEKIGRCLPYFKNVLILQLSINRTNSINNDGLVFICEGLKNLIQLQQLKIVLDSNDKINENGFQKLSQCISFLINLTKITIKIYNNTISYLAINELTQGISNLSQLTSLKFHFVKNKLNAESFKLIGNLFRNLNLIHQLKIMTCHQEHIGNEGIEGLLQSISQLQNLQNLKLQILQLKEKESIPIDLVSSFQNLKKILILNIDISDYYIEWFQMIQSKPILQNLRVLNIQFNTIESIENKAIISESLQNLLNLVDLTITCTPKKNVLNNMIIKIHEIELLLQGLQKCKNLQFLHVNTETQYDYLFLTLLEDLPKIQRLVLQRNSTIQVTRQILTNKITQLIIPYSSAGKHKQLEQLEYIAIALNKFKSLESIKIDILDIQSIQYENDNTRASLVYDQTLAQWKSTFKKMKQSTKQSIKYLVSVLKNHDKIKSFEFGIVDGRWKQIQKIIGKRHNNQSDFFIQVDIYIVYKQEILPNLLFLSEILINLEKSVYSIKFNINNYYLFNRTYIDIFGVAIQRLQNLQIAEIIFKKQIIEHSTYQNFEQYFSGLINLQYFKFICEYSYGDQKYYFKKKKLNFKLLRKDPRLVFYK